MSVNCAGSAAADLDQRYVEFAEKTQHLFAQFPRMEPMRHFIFRELLVQQRSAGFWRSVGLLDAVKYAMHRDRQDKAMPGGRERADMLIWVESARDAIIDTVLPVYWELVSRGVKVQLVSYGGPTQLPSSTVQFRHRSEVFAPAWTSSAWQALCETFEELRGRGLQRSFSRACANVESLFHALLETLDMIQPKVVLCAAANLIGGAALTMASRWKGSLTFLLQHGMTQAFYTPLIADYMLTWGISSNETLARLGVPTSRCIALGSPRHDLMCPRPDGSARGAFLTALSLPDKPTFTFFSNGNDLLRNGTAPAECASWLDEVAAHNREKLNVVVRLHPNEDGRLYKSCRNVEVTKSVPDLACTLEGSDIVGSLCSTVLYDALLYRKPVLQFHGDGWPELADNWKDALAVRIPSPSHLNDVLNALRPGGEAYTAIVSAQEKNAEKVFANHGSASKVIAEHLIRHL